MESTAADRRSKASKVAVVNLSGSLHAKNRVPEGNSLGSIRPWVAKRPHDGLTDGLGLSFVCRSAFCITLTVRRQEKFRCFDQ